MKKPAKTTTRKTSVVELGGDLTIRGIGPAHEQLLSKVRSVSSIQVSIDESAPVDLALVQLIEAARRELRDAGGALTLAKPAPQPLVEVLTRGGFLEAADSRGFWLGAGE